MVQVLTFDEFRGDGKLNFSSQGSLNFFYLSHMEYEESVGFVSRKMKKNYC
jgi:hypothetical protein